MRAGLDRFLVICPSCQLVAPASGNLPLRCRQISRQQVARMSEAICGIGTQDPDIASLIRATLALRRAWQLQGDKHKSSVALPSGRGERLTTRKGWNVMHGKVVALVALVAAALGFAACGPAWAGWPDDKPIEVVIGFAPGGATDVMARKLLPFVEQRLGGKAKFVVLNKPGAGGEIDPARRAGRLLDRRGQCTRLQLHPDDAKNPVQHGRDPPDRARG